jgi:hypothetical protein
MKNNYVGKACWQARGYVSISVGHVVEQKMEGSWLMLLISWIGSKDQTWEKISNISFNIDIVGSNLDKNSYKVVC